MKALIWRLRQGAHRLGGTGLAGLGMLLAALLLVLETGSQQRRNAVQQERLVELRLEIARRAAAPAPQPLNPLAALPPDGTAAQQIGELEQLARAHGLDLPLGQYSVAPLMGTSLQRWQLVLPVEASYPALHAFLAAALERQPNLTLDELKLQRDSIESAELEAELRLSLFAEAAP
jgi:type II secretory pathway pseudopilin PulG